MIYAKKVLAAQTEPFSQTSPTLASVPVVDVWGNPTELPIVRKEVLKDIEDAVTLLKPDRVIFLERTPEVIAALKRQMVEAKTLIPLNPARRPNSFLYRSDPTDTARDPDKTYVCCTNPADAGPLNKHMSPDQANSIYDRDLPNAYQGKVRARDTEIGLMPYEEDLDLQGLTLSPVAKEALFTVNKALWQEEAKAKRKVLTQDVGPGTPQELIEELERLEQDLGMPSPS